MGLRLREDLDLKWHLKARKRIQQGFESHNTQKTLEHIILCRMINKSKPVSSSLVACHLLSHSMTMPPMYSASSCCIGARIVRYGSLSSLRRSRTPFISFCDCNVCKNVSVIPKRICLVYMCSLGLRGSS